MMYEKPDDDYVIFVSHRWWNPTEGLPDDNEGTKYRIVSDAILQVVAKHSVDISRVVIWCDYACIDQDDHELQVRGINSLIAYAAQSNAIVIPVHPSTEENAAFAKAEHPTDLVNYGDRAWCRLETYMFMCVGEILMRPIHSYAFGQLPPSVLSSLTSRLSISKKSRW